MLARIPEPELDALLRGYGYHPVIVAGTDPVEMHHEMAAALDSAIARIREIQQRRGRLRGGRPRRARRHAGR